MSVSTSTNIISFKLNQNVFTVVWPMRSQSSYTMSFGNVGSRVQASLCMGSSKNSLCSLSTEWILVSLRWSQTSLIIGWVGFTDPYRKTNQCNVLIDSFRVLILSFLCGQFIESITHSITKPWQTPLVTRESYQKMALQASQPHGEWLCKVFWQWVDRNTQ